MHLNTNDIPELPSEPHSFFLLPGRSVTLPSGAKIRYREAGHGPDILLVHGLWTTDYTFRSLVLYLAESYHLVIPELIDFDNAQLASDRQFTPSDISRILSDLCTVLSLQKPLIVGHEESGLAAMELAIDHPEIIHGVLAISPRVSLSMGSRISGWWRSRSDASSWARSGLSQPIKAALGMVHYADPAMLSRQELRVLAKGWSTLPAASLRARVLAATMTHDYPQASMDKIQLLAKSGKGLGVALKLIYGDMDSSAPPSHGQRIISLLPGAELLIAEGCGTAAQIERPEWTAGVIANFFQDK